MVKIILRTVSVGLGIATLVLLILNSISERDALQLLALGLSCVSISFLPSKKAVD